MAQNTVANACPKLLAATAAANRTPHVVARAVRRTLSSALVCTNCRRFPGERCRRETGTSLARDAFVRGLRPRRSLLMIETNSSFALGALIALGLLAGCTGGGSGHCLGGEQFRCGGTITCGGGTQAGCVDTHMCCGDAAPQG